MKRRAIAASLALLVLMLGAARAEAAVNIKEDNSRLVTGYWAVPEDIVTGVRTRGQLIAKLVNFEVQRVPDRLPISETYFIYPECNGNLVARGRPITPQMRDFIVRCQ